MSYRYRVAGICTILAIIGAFAFVGISIWALSQWLISDFQKNNDGPIERIEKKNKPK